MFRLASTAAFLILAVATLGLVYTLVRPDANLNSEYASVVANTGSERPPIGLQYRKQVHKDVWLSKSGQRLHHTFSCAKSTLEFAFSDRGIVEKMEDVTGVMEEGEPGISRKIDAQTATYTFETNQIAAQKATITRYREQLPLFCATAREMELKLDGSSDFVAKGLSATFDKMENL